jgi:hypothetical protein
MAVAFTSVTFYDSTIGWPEYIHIFPLDELADKSLKNSLFGNAQVHYKCISTLPLYCDRSTAYGTSNPKYLNFCNMCRNHTILYYSVWIRRHLVYLVCTGGTWSWRAAWLLPGQPCCPLKKGIMYHRKCKKSAFICLPQSQIIVEFVNPV